MQAAAACAILSLQDRRLAAAVHGDRHAAVRRRPGAPGDAADRRPAGDARAGAVRLRPHRQRPVRAVRRRLRPTRSRSASRTSTQAKSLLKAAGHENLTRRPAHHQRRGRHGRLGRRSSPHQAKAAGVNDQREERPELLRRPVPEAGLLGRLLGHPRVPQPGAAGLAAELARTTRRTGRRSRAPGSNFGRSTTRRWPRPTPTKRIDIMHQMQQVRVQHRRLHHPVLQRPHRRLRGQGQGASSRARAPSTWTASAMATAPSGSASTGWSATAAAAVNRLPTQRR